MIRRNSSKYVQDQERLEQQSFTGIKGIDCSKIHTDVTTVYNMTNLDVDLDGGLKLRKPLTAALKSSSQIYHMYDGTLLEISKSIIKSPTYNKTKFYDMYGTEYIKDIDCTSCVDCLNVKVINTATSTLLYNCKVDFSKLKKLIPDDIMYINTVESNVQYRLIKLSNKNKVFQLEILPAEMNILTTSDIPLDYNLALEYPLAIRDNYDSAAVNITGIIAYSKTLQDKIVAADCGFTGFEENTTVDTPGNGTLYLKGGADEDVLSYNILNTSYNSKYEFYIEYDVNSNNIATFKYVLKIKNAPKVITNASISIKLGSGYTLGSENPISFERQGESVLITLTYNVVYKVDYIRLAEVFVTLNIPNVQTPIEKVTETTKDGWSFLKNLDENTDKVICLKAFLDIPYSFGNTAEATQQYVMLWEKTTDGKTWEVVEDTAITAVDFEKVAYYDINTTVLESDTYVTWNQSDYYRKLSLKYLKDTTVEDRYITKRPDCLILDSSKLSQNQMYKCSIYSVRSMTSEEETNLNAPIGYKARDVLISSKIYTFNSNLAGLADVEYVNPYSGNVLYYKKSLYAFGKGLENVVYVSAPDSAMFPITNVIDLSTVQDAYVTAIVPWRDYLMISTENSIHLASSAEIGYTTKILNTFVGIPERDSKTGAAILNGIIFKSGTKIYTMFPNLNAGVETIFNTSEISKPVEHILTGIKEHDDYRPFAITTSEAYYLFIPCKDNSTVCLKYIFTQKRWTCYNYPVLIYRHVVLNAEDIRLFGYLDEDKNHPYVEYYFNKSSEGYADVLGDLDDKKNPIETPIKFMLDSGQKTDNISLTKQFVESKLIVSTLSEIDNFKMDVRVDIDGNTFDKHIDVNTDGAFLRTGSNLLTLNTATNLFADAETLDTFRQMFLRYSGKGKTIRHIISGESNCPFKIYEVFFRFKYLNIKQ